MVIVIEPFIEDLVWRLGARRWSLSQAIRNQPYRTRQLYRTRPFDHTAAAHPTLLSTDAVKFASGWLQVFMLYAFILEHRARTGDLLGIGFNARWRRLVEKDKHQGVSGLGHCIAALTRYFSGHAACVLRNHFAEAIALNGHLLSGFDLVVELDQMLDEAARGGEDRERTVADKDTHILACAPHWPGNDAMMLEDVHCAFHEQRDHLEV